MILDAITYRLLPKVKLAIKLAIKFGKLSSNLSIMNDQLNDLHRT